MLKSITRAHHNIIHHDTQYQKKLIKPSNILKLKPHEKN